ncbi:MAG: hypothetical protein ACYTGR_13525 [Planctomycetota bacterium]|jgi:hypothetical protein
MLIGLLLVAILLACLGTIAIGLRLGLRTRANPECGRCGYDVSESIGHGSRCPECGGAFAHVGIRPIRMRANRRSILITVLVSVVLCAFGISIVGLLTAVQVRVEAERALARAIAAQSQQQMRVGTVMNQGEDQTTQDDSAAPAPANEGTQVDAAPDVDEPR